jgi:hypothetical protein
LFRPELPSQIAIVENRSRLQGFSSTARQFVTAASQLH